MQKITKSHFIATLIIMGFIYRHTYSIYKEQYMLIKYDIHVYLYTYKPNNLEINLGTYYDPINVSGYKAALLLINKYIKDN